MLNTTDCLGAIFQRYNLPAQAIEWASGKPVTEDVWRFCPNTSWPLELAIKLEIEKKVTGQASLVNFPFENDLRIEKSVEVAIKFLQGKATENEMETAFVQAKILIVG